MFWNWCHSRDISQLKVGMIVAVPTHTHTNAGARWGHIAIYVGNGLVMDNIGYIRTTSLAWGSVEKVGVRALAAPVSDIRNQLIS